MILLVNKFQNKKRLSMKYIEMNQILIERFPELKEKVNEVLQFWGKEKPPEHVFFGNVLNEYVSKLLVLDGCDAELNKIFDFYEEMASCDDDDVVNLLQTTLLEYLWDEEDVYNNAQKYMKKNTRILNNEIHDYLAEPTASDKMNMNLE